ncbi:hypothetical protein MMC07_008602 [Pseudocyphellaria aurata]|nr:hypothetical protein [Pseudocyphellaria aurata]
MSTSQASVRELRSQDHFIVQEAWMFYALKQGCNRICHWSWTVLFYLIQTLDYIYILLYLVVTGTFSLCLSGLTRCTRVDIRRKLGLSERDSDWELPVSGIDHRFVDVRKQRLDRQFFQRSSYRQKGLVEPRPLPPRRKYRLSEISLGSQPPANLLMRLPLELRREIYEYVLVSDSRNLHVSQDVNVPNRRTRLFSYACEHPWELHVPKDIRLRGFHHRPGELGPANCFPYAMPPNRLALVKVCRQVYIEAIDIIYSLRAVNLFIYLNLAGSNKPSFGDPWVQRLLALQQTTNVITDLEVKPCDWVALPKVEALGRFEAELKAQLFRSNDSSPVP